MHLSGTSSGNDVGVLDGPADNHDGVVKRPLDLINKLVCSTTKDEGAALGLGATPENVEPLSSDLDLLKLGAGAEVLGLEVVHRCLDGTANSLDCPDQITLGDTTGAENTPVGEELGSQVTNGELCKNR